MPVNTTFPGTFFEILEYNIGTRVHAQLVTYTNKQFQPFVGDGCVCRRLCLDSVELNKNHRVSTPHLLILTYMYQCILYIIYKLHQFVK